jgi:hypothetical protein
MYDFQQAMADGKARTKRAIERSGGSSVQVFTSSQDRWRGVTEEDWHAMQAEIDMQRDDHLDIDWDLVGGGVDASPPEGAPKTEEKTAHDNRVGSPKNQQGEPIEHMAGEEYKRLLAALGYEPYNSAIDNVLGVKKRMSMRYAAGSHPIPEPVAKLLRILAKLGTASP